MPTTMMLMTMICKGRRRERTSSSSTPQSHRWDHSGREEPDLLAWALIKCMASNRWNRSAGASRPRAAGTRAGASSLPQECSLSAEELGGRRGRPDYAMCST